MYLVAVTARHVLFNLLYVIRLSGVVCSAGIIQYQCIRIANHLKFIACFACKHPTSVNFSREHPWLQQYIVLFALVIPYRHQMTVVMALVIRLPHTDHFLSLSSSLPLFFYCRSPSVLVFPSISLFMFVVRYVKSLRLQFPVVSNLAPTVLAGIL